MRLSEQAGPPLGNCGQSASCLVLAQERLRLALRTVPKGGGIAGVRCGREPNAQPGREGEPRANGQRRPNLCAAGAAGREI